LSLSLIINGASRSSGLVVASNNVQELGEMTGVIDVDWGRHGEGFEYQRLLGQECVDMKWKEGRTWRWNGCQVQAEGGTVTWKEQDHVRHPHHVGEEAAAAADIDQSGGASCWGSGIYTNLQLD
jgi:hypothetical protein